MNLMIPFQKKTLYIRTINDSPTSFSCKKVCKSNIAFTHTGLFDVEFVCTRKLELKYALPRLGGNFAELPTELFVMFPHMILFSIQSPLNTLPSGGARNYIKVQQSQ